MNDDIFEQAHQTSARYKREESEFEKTGLTAQYTEDFAAPFVQEANIQIGLTFEREYSLRGE